MDALLRRRMMIAGGAQPEPTLIPYVRNSTGAYIDTGITPDSTTQVIIWARNWQPAGGILFGSNDSSNHFWLYSLYGTSTDGKIGVAYGPWGSPYPVVSDQFINLSGYHKYDFYQGIFKVDDVTVYTNSSSFSGNSNNMYLFGRNNSGTLEGLKLPADICACKIYKNGSLVRDYTAVESPSVGLYDAVSDTVFTNAGSGSLTYGEFNERAYTPLEYITCTGSQYFDSGAKGSYADSLVVKFMPTNTTAAWTTLLGYRTATNSCDISLGTATSTQDNMRCYWRFGTNETSGTAYNGSTSNKLTNKECIAAKMFDSSELRILYDGASIGSNNKTGVSSSFESAGTLAIGTFKQSSTSFSNLYFIGRIYYVGLGSSRSFVPARVNGVAGLYDTYNDVFYPSATSTPFIEGPTI